MNPGLRSIAPLSGHGALVRVKRPGERRSSSRSATRALDVLELFGDVRGPLRAIEISKALDMNPSSTNQLLKTMVDSAHLIFNARSKTYLPSPRLASFGTWMVDCYGTGGLARELVGEIRQRTGMVTTLSTPNDLFMQIIDLARPEGQMAERGLRVSLFGSAIGSAYLSTLEREEIVRLADRARIAEQEIPAFCEALARIRTRGFADGPSPDSCIWSVGVPLPGQRLPVPAVLGLAGPADRVRHRVADLARLMHDAIDRVFGNAASVAETGEASAVPVPCRDAIG